MTEWDAARYHRISEPQFDWGKQVIERLAPADGERILDLGCGTGRLTQEIQHLVPGGRVVGLDSSGAMLAVARATTESGRSRAPAYVQASGTALPLRNAVDAVFSAATLHWIHDHDAVFAGVYEALVPGGRFVAQCGGQGNLARLLEHTVRLMQSPAYEPYFRDWREPWHFADADGTAERLRTAGFADVRTWIEAAPVDLRTAPAYAEFVACVCVRHHLDRLPFSLREPFAHELAEAAARDAPPLTLDYQRLNIQARKPSR